MPTLLKPVDIHSMLEARLIIDSRRGLTSAAEENNRRCLSVIKLTTNYDNYS